ncbi:hypothetical protein INT48_004819 [Thamnidium elegans]|uniref:Uncharacterized protein n=1 Tax=Thamnidium elegans TaxID=101142 RepID=A0A8H7SM52_9FUNG|nr:hypothetical protein INT48_004819 [Thamnidium elegans]
MNPTNDNQTFETIMFDPKAKKADGRKRQVMDEPEDSTQPNTKKKSKNPKGEWTPARRLAVLKLYEDFRPLEIFHSVEVDFEELDQFQIKNLRDIYKNAEDDVKKALRAANDIRFDNEDYKEMVSASLYNILIEYSHPAPKRTLEVIETKAEEAKAEEKEKD